MRERWEQVKEILASALEKELSERDQFIDMACGSDKAMRKEVQSLLAHYAEADAILENPPAHALFKSHGTNLIGRQLGAYRILKETGHGGMAVVYEAQRADDQFKKRVAIKMLKAAFASAEMERRFRTERQMLAALDHPHIVKLLDGGTAEEGWPYIVMDFVEGLPIDEYCSKHQLSVRDRLELFRLVCLAVGHAHRNQVIHRDLKPHNILITSDGVPRLLDFGIAKLLGAEGEPGSATTIGDSRPMTPEYASPEQVRGLPVTGATDVYSLGVLLYRLLTGIHPYRMPLTSWLEVEHAICVEVPASPSTVVKNREQQRRLRGDLDTITMTALRKEAELRYASAEEFAADIERYVRGLPVKARRLTISYRTTKFLRRHREAVLTATAVFVLGALAVSWEGYRLQNNSGAESSLASSHKVRPSVAVLGFRNLTGRQDLTWMSTALSEMLDAELASGEALRIIPGETVARSRIDLKLPESERLTSVELQRVHRDLGSEYVVSGDYFDAGNGQVRLKLNLQDTAHDSRTTSVSEIGSVDNLSSLISRSSSELRSRLGISAVSELESRRAQAATPSDAPALRFYSEGLARLRTFDALAARGLLEKSIAADDAFPLSHMALATAWQTLGYDQQAMKEARLALDRAGRLSREEYLVVQARSFETSRNWEKAIETYRALFTFFPDNLEYGLSLARAQTSSGRGKDALVTLAELEKSAVGWHDDPRIDLARSDAGASLGDAKLRRDASERAAQKAAQQGAQLLVARARLQECRALADLGEYSQAPPVCEDGRRIYAEAGDRGGLARILHATAETPLDQDDWASAETLYRQALDLAREIGDQQGTARELGNLALTFKYRGDLDTAISMQKEALRIQTEIGDRNGAAIQTGNIGGSLGLQGKLDEALKYFRRSLEISNEIANRNTAAIAMSNIGGILALKGDLPESLKIYRQALSLHRELGSRFYYANDLQEIGDLLRLRGDLESSRKSYEEVVAVREEIGERDGTAKARLALAVLACDAGNPADAEKLALNSLAIVKSARDTSGQVLAQLVLTRSLREQNRLSEARASLGAAGRIAGKTPYPVIGAELMLEQSALLAAERDLDMAEKLAQSVLIEASRNGMIRYRLESSLELGRIQALKGNTAPAQERLEEVAKAAHLRGFEPIARRAHALSESLIAAK